MTGVVCGWTSSCTERARHTVRSHTRPGLVLTFHVCDLHRRIALSQGYHAVDPPETDEAAPWERPQGQRTARDSSGRTRRMTDDEPGNSGP